jgi:hypothetical protein
LFEFVRNAVDAVRELHDACLTATKIIGADLSIRNTAVEAALRVRLVLAETIASSWSTAASTETEDEVKSAVLLNIVVVQLAAFFELLASEDETLLIGRDAFLVLDLGLDVIDGVSGLDFESDVLAGEGADEDLHDVLFYESFF